MASTTATTYTVARYGRPAVQPHERDRRPWAIYDSAGLLVCVTVYRKGAVEVIRRLSTCPHHQEGS